MENLTINQIQTEESDIFKNIVPTSAIVTNIQMKSGKKTTITTLFCSSEFSFEEINRGVRDSLNRQNWLCIDKSKSVLYSLKGGQAKKILEFREDSYNR